MGDHRVYIKIEFDAHGKNYKTEMDINYWPDDYSGVDHRIAEWFQQCWEDALGRYNRMVYDSQKEQREREEREKELAELKRLQQKYGAVAESAARTEVGEKNPGAAQR